MSTKYISVATAYQIYEVPEETFQVLSSGAMTTPPHLVLEVMVMNGQAKRIGTVGAVTLDPEDGEFEGDDEDTPWVEDQDD